MAFDFNAVTTPFRMQPGLRRLAPGVAQLTPNRLGDRALAEKLGVLVDHPHEALLGTPGIDALPLLKTFSAHAATEQPQALRWDGDRHWKALLLGWSLRGDALEGDGAPEIGACLRALPAQWRPAGLLALAFAEDIALIDARSGSIPWMAVCLPSHWAPEDKVGRHFTEVHAPVADNATLLAAGTHLMRLATGEQRWERFVWTITPHAALRQHPRHLGAIAWPDDATPDQLADAAFFRTERQTFIPITGAEQAIFTIHVESSPLAHVITEAGQKRVLHAALASMSPDVLAYRGLADARDRLLTWLA